MVCFSACGPIQSFRCLNYCHPVLFMCWNNFLMSWGNYLSSLSVGVLCVTLLLIHAEKHNVKPQHLFIFPSELFLHPCGLTLYYTQSGEVTRWTLKQWPYAQLALQLAQAERNLRREYLFHTDSSMTVTVVILGARTQGEISSL